MWDMQRWVTANVILTLRRRLSSVPNILPLTSSLDFTCTHVQPYTMYHILLLGSAGVHTLTLRKKKNDKASLRMRIKITTQWRCKVTVPLSARDRQYRLQSIVWCYQYTDVQNSSVSYSEDPLNKHNIMLALRLPADSRLSSQQLARIP